MVADAIAAQPVAELRVLEYGADAEVVGPEVYRGAVRRAVA